MVNPLKQENGDPWPDRRPGCLRSGRCVFKHSCGETDSKKCKVIIDNDAGAAIVARGIADGTDWFVWYPANADLFRSSLLSTRKVSHRKRLAAQVRRRSFLGGEWRLLEIRRRSQAIDLA